MIGLMTDTIGQTGDLPQRGNLTDFVYGVDENNSLQIEVAVKEDGKCAVFHNKPFRKDLSWLEFDLDTFELDFVLDNGEIRNVGLPLTKDVAKNMQNSHQVLMILMDDKTGDAKEGHYVPLFLHKK